MEKHKGGHHVEMLNSKRLMDKIGDDLHVL